MDSLRVKTRAGSGRIPVEHGTQCRETTKSTCPSVGKGWPIHIQRVFSFMLPFLCTWCYHSLDPMAPTASLNCCWTPHHPSRPNSHLFCKICMMPLSLSHPQNSHHHPCYSIIIFTCLCFLQIPDPPEYQKNIPVTPCASKSSKFFATRNCSWEIIIIFKSPWLP